MRRPRSGPKKIVRSFSCTDWQREEIGKRAAEAGMNVSPFVIERGLTVDPGAPEDEAGPLPSLALGREEQRQLHDRIAGIAERWLGAAPPDPAGMAELPAVLGVLLERLMTDMIEMGQEERMRGLLRDAFGEVRGSELARQYAAKARRPGS